MSERRRSARYAMDHVRGVLHFSADARVLNMSLSGAALETSIPMRLGRTYTMTICDRAGQELKLQGEVVRCRLRALAKGEGHDSAPVYEAGMHFGGTLTDAATDLLRFLERSAIVEVGQRILGRFILTAGAMAKIDSGLPFLVKSISLSGMLIETEIAHPVGATFDLEIDLAGQTLHARGRIAFSQQVKRVNRPALAALGVEFVDLEPETQEMLGALIQRELAPPDGDQALA